MVLVYVLIFVYDQYIKPTSHFVHANAARYVTLTSYW